MDILKKINTNEDTILYEILQNKYKFDIYIASSDTMINLLNTPECYGVKFQKKISTSIYKALSILYKTEDKKISEHLKNSPIDTFYILRGGLNFNLHENIYRLIEKTPEVSFISSQRISCKDGTFKIDESTYQKWNIQDRSLLCIGDICATGTTIVNMITNAIKRYNFESKKPRWLLIITIGTKKMLNELSNYNFDCFEGVTIIFLEAVFNLFGNTSLSNINIPYTDFFRKNTIRSIQFEKLSLSNPTCFLERCAIYDGGSRSFEPKGYFNNLYTYWEKLFNQSNILNIKEFLSLRSDLLNYELDYDNWLSNYPYWNKLDDNLFPIYTEGKAQLNELLSKKFGQICEERLTTLKKIKDKL